MILVDTSVLIDFLKGSNSKTVDKLNYIIEKNIPFGITSFTYMEILQGAKSEKEFALLDEYLSTQIFFQLKHQIKSFKEAAKLRLNCNKNGITINSTIDFLIVQTALDNNLFLLHNDKDFEKIGSVIDLKFY